jgi:hypothetical protein
MLPMRGVSNQEAVAIPPHPLRLFLLEVPQRTPTPQNAVWSPPKAMHSNERTLRLSNFVFTSRPLFEFLLWEQIAPAKNPQRRSRIQKRGGRIFG